MGSKINRLSQLIHVNLICLNLAFLINLHLYIGLINWKFECEHFFICHFSRARLPKKKIAKRIDK